MKNRWTNRARATRYSSMMDVGRVFGPAFRRIPAVSGLRLRSLTLDLEDLLDALGVMVDRWDPNHTLRENGAVTRDDHSSDIRGPLTEEQAHAFGAYDRSRLTLRRSLILPDGVERSVIIQCPVAEASVTVSGSGDTLVEYSAQTVSDEEFLAGYLVENGTSRPTWGRLRFLLPLIAVPIIAVGYVGVLLTSELNGFAHILVLTLVALALTGVVMWSRVLSKKDAHVRGTFRVRAHSRRESNADRANRKANLAVMAYTAPVTLAIGTAVAWISGILKFE